MNASIEDIEVASIDAATAMAATAEFLFANGAMLFSECIGGV